MSTPHNLFGTFQKFDLGNGKSGNFYSLPALGKSRRRRDLKTAGFHPDRLGIRPAQLRRQKGQRDECQGTGELAADRDAHGGNPVRRRAHCVAGFHRRAVAGGFGGDAQRGVASSAKIRKSSSRSCRWIWWWITRCRWISPATRMRWRRTWIWNFTRNRERYQFLKWGMQAFDTFKVVPPGIGIVHQVNLEYLAKGVLNCGRTFIIPTRWSARIRTRR